MRERAGEADWMGGASNDGERDAAFCGVVMS